MSLFRWNILKSGYGMPGRVYTLEWEVYMHNVIIMLSYPFTAHKHRPFLESPANDSTGYINAVIVNVSKWELYDAISFIDIISYIIHFVIMY